ncbi:MAG: hypothetical protein IH987_18135 [Planctomycetes bacterium]|nr:hypothetical protein [Planctomycetota bacterium]
MVDPLQEIPGVGPSISADLRALGIERVADLVGREPPSRAHPRST